MTRLLAIIGLMTGLVLVPGAQASSLRVAVTPTVAATVTVGLVSTPSGGVSRRFSVAAGRVNVLVGSHHLVSHIAPRARSTWVVAGTAAHPQLIRLDSRRVGAIGARAVRIVNAVPSGGQIGVGVHRSAQPMSPLAANAASGWYALPSTSDLCGQTAVLEVRRAETLVGLPRIGASSTGGTTAVIYGLDLANMYPLSVMTFADAAPTSGIYGFHDSPSTVLAEPVRVAPGIRIFDAATHAGAVHVEVGNSSHWLVYGDGTRHIPVSAGAHHVRIVAGGRTLTERVVHTSPTHPSFTFVFTDGPAGDELALYEDREAGGSSASLRVINAQPQSGSLDYRVVDGPVIAAGLVFGSASRALAVDDRFAARCMGVVHVDISRGGVVIKQSVVTLDPGKSYTAFTIRPHGAPLQAVKQVLFRDSR